MDSQPKLVAIRLPASLHSWLKQVAADNRRSVNAQAIVILEQAQRQQQPHQK
jgi:hypothetical protein